MCLTYFAEDYEYYDYKPWFIGNNVYRGENNVKNIYKEKYCVILGAAQTFGRRSGITFSDIIGNKLGIKFINLSHGGNSPEKILSNINSNKLYRNILLNANKIILQLVSPKNTRDDKGRYCWHPGADLSFPENKNKKMMYKDFWQQYIKKYGESSFVDLWYDIQLKYSTEMTKIIKCLNKNSKIILLNTFKNPLKPSKNNKYIPSFPHIYPRIIELLKQQTDSYVEFNMSPHFPAPIYENKNTNADYNLNTIKNNISPQSFNIFNSLKTQNHPTIATNRQSIYPTKEAHKKLAEALNDYFS